jgi:hypothetical protein
VCAQTGRASQFEWRFSVDAECPVLEAHFRPAGENRKLSAARLARANSRELVRLRLCKT